MSCPECGERVIVGYGLAGGGMGTYEYCVKCWYLKKLTEDEDETIEIIRRFKGTKNVKLESLSHDIPTLDETLTLDEPISPDLPTLDEVDSN
jgi:hypothetical protein